MGTALVSGIINSSQSDQSELRFSVSANSQASLERLQGVFASNKDQVDLITNDNVEAAHDSDVIILGFQPHQLFDVLSDSALREAIRGKLVISILAGTTSLQVAEAVYKSQDIAPETRVCCAIPSIGAQIGESMTLVADTALSGSDRDLVAWLFQLVGQVQLVPEKLLSTVVGIGATCHALMVVATDAVVDGSVAEGVARPLALAVASQCFRSAATLLQEKMTIDSLKESMSVAKGITINALLQLERGQVRSGISDAVRSAAQYSSEMSKEKQ